jgi:cobyrinic acid a,c-diamide synthase
VNVRVPSPPQFLREVIVDTITGLGAYPRTDAAVSAIAAAHGVPESAALPTAGAAEAFTLLARALSPVRPLVVHPQFTEPEAALRTAGHQPTRLLLEPATRFVLDADRVDEEADLIMIGNPTNPTSVLHPADVLRSLVRPGRVVCVDEAFMDTVPGETESMLRHALDGVVVLRSLTKTWGLAGLRAGYVVGDPEIVARMRRQQQPWSVSTPALAATIACLTPAAQQIAAEAAQGLAVHRSALQRALTAVGLSVAGDPAASFVLVDTSGWPPPAGQGSRPPGWVRLALRERGFAVRRGETFPGLHADWVRIAVRDPATTRALADALVEIQAATTDSHRPGSRQPVSTGKWE